MVKVVVCVIYGLMASVGGEREGIEYGRTSPARIVFQAPRLALVPVPRTGAPPETNVMVVEGRRSLKPMVVKTRVTGNQGGMVKGSELQAPLRPLYTMGVKKGSSVEMTPLGHGSTFWDWT
ncbi:hypothetical protein K1719_000032 [Acacia pycnantha]|nr:hypothetical protein K1719_000032 [Acacia pycnantha]